MCARVIGVSKPWILILMTVSAQQTQSIVESQLAVQVWTCSHTLRQICQKLGKMTCYKYDKASDLVQSSMQKAL